MHEKGDLCDEVVLGGHPYYFLSSKEAREMCLLVMSGLGDLRAGVENANLFRVYIDGADVFWMSCLLNLFGTDVLAVEI